MRHELLPLLEDIRVGSAEAIGRASEDARRALEYLESQADDVWREACDTAVDEQSVRIDRNVLRGAHVALRHVVLERAVVAMLGSAEGLSRANYVAMDALIMDGRTGSKVTLPRELRLSCLSGSQAALSIGEPPVPIARVAAAELCIDGETQAGGWMFTSRKVECGIEVSASAEGAELLPGPLRSPRSTSGTGNGNCCVRTRERRETLFGCPAAIAKGSGCISLIARFLRAWRNQYSHRVRRRDRRYPVADGSGCRGGCYAYEVAIDD